MADNNVLFEISAFSGLAGAIITQAFTGVLTYFGDKRKAISQLKNTYRDKQLEIAENYYFMTGETMSVLKKSIAYWNDRSKSRSETSIAFFNKEMKKLDAYMEKLNTDNWKHNLITLYFDVLLSYNELIDINNTSHSLYLSLLDKSDQIKKASDEKKDKLIGEYHLGIFDLVGQYEAIYTMLEKDMNTVKRELLSTFQVK